MIYLIRHGVTKANESGAYCGHSDCELSETGIKELEGYKYLYEGLNQTIYTSPLSRCVETARILFERDVDHIIESFKEMNFGSFEGYTHDELKNNPDYIKWLDDFYENTPPNGESFDGFIKRVIDEFGELGDDIILVVHGGVIRAIMNYLFDIPFFEIDTPNGLGYKIDMLNNNYELILSGE